MMQIYALLSPRAAHQLTWNRFTKRKKGPGGNIPLDLNLEFWNRSVKEAIKKLGPNASRKSIDRICNSLKITKTLMQNFESDVQMYKTSGKHVQKSVVQDLQTVVKELVHEQALIRIPGRIYRYYTRMKSSLLAGFDINKMFSWINDHKRYILQQRRAR